MKTEKQFIEWIEKQIKFYSPILGIELQRVKVEKWENSVDKDYLSIKCVYPYADPDIRYAPKVFDDWKNGKMEKDRILHELCHIITDPLYVKANQRDSSETEILDERERLTDIICVIIRNLIK